MHPRLIIIRGNSGSGKTTVAKRLRYEMGHGTMLVSQDVIRRDIVRVRDTPDNPAIQLIHDTALYGKRIGYNVILEGILCAKNYHTMIDALVAEFGDTTLAYYFDISFEETLRRHASKPNANDYGENAMRGWWCEKDFLGVKNEKTITEDMDENAIVELILSEINSVHSLSAAAPPMVQ